jgi:hypothetical protein
VLFIAVRNYTLHHKLHERSHTHTHTHCIHPVSAVCLFICQAGTNWAGHFHFHFHCHKPQAACLTMCFLCSREWFISSLLFEPHKSVRPSLDCLGHQNSETFMTAFCRSTKMQRCRSLRLGTLYCAADHYVLVRCTALQITTSWYVVLRCRSLRLGTLYWAADHYVLVRCTELQNNT